MQQENCDFKSHLNCFRRMCPLKDNDTFELKATIRINNVLGWSAYYLRQTNRHFVFRRCSSVFDGGYHNSGTMPSSAKESKNSQVIQNCCFLFWFFFLFFFFENIKLDLFSLPTVLLKIITTGHLGV